MADPSIPATYINGSEELDDSCMGAIPTVDEYGGQLLGKLNLPSTPFNTGALMIRVGLGSLKSRHDQEPLGLRP